VIFLCEWSEGYFFSYVLETLFITVDERIIGTLIRVVENLPGKDQDQDQDQDQNQN